MGRQRRILYLQYTNPSGYPPLINGVRTLTGNGWHILLIGVEHEGTVGLRFPPLAGTELKLLRRSHLPSRVHYLLFLCWAVFRGLLYKPAWLYSSDALSAPAAMILRSLSRAKIVYHEHDTPAHADSSAMRLVMKQRERLILTADMLIVPTKERLAPSGTDGPGKLHVVWNCPSVTEVITQPVEERGRLLHLWYHGSLGPDLLPEALLTAVAQLEGVTLTVVGYETVGTRGYTQKLRDIATDLGLSDRVTLRGPIDRSSLLQQAASADVGLVLFTQAITQQQALVGASNKPFDYLASALALLVPDSSEWEETFVHPGYGLSCDPQDVASIVQSLSWMTDNRSAVREMGQRGRARVQSEWNYEAQFRPVLDAFERSGRT